MSKERNQIQRGEEKTWSPLAKCHALAQPPPRVPQSLPAEMCCGCTVPSHPALSGRWWSLKEQLLTTSFAFTHDNFPMLLSLLSHPSCPPAPFGVLHNTRSHNTLQQSTTMLLPAPKRHGSRSWDTSQCPTFPCCSAGSDANIHIPIQWTLAWQYSWIWDLARK